MSIRKIVNIERLNGSGTVFAGDKEVARVLYSLRVDQTMTNSGQDEIPGAISTSGHLMVMDGEKDLVNMGRLTLVLDDDRKWEFIFTRTNRISGDYQISVSNREE